MITTPEGTEEIVVTTKDGRQLQVDITDTAQRAAKADTPLGESHYFSSGASDSPTMEHLAMVGRLAKASEQLPQQSAMINYTREGLVETPPVPLDYYVQLLRGDSVHGSCVEAKVYYIAMQGFRIRPRSEMALLDQSLAPLGGEAPTTDPIELDYKGRVAIEEFTELGMPENTFPELLGNFWRDVEALGQGYLELSRDDAGKINGIYPMTGSTVHLLADGTGYLHQRGGKFKIYSKYHPDKAKRIRSVELEGTREEKSTVGRSKADIWSVLNRGTVVDGMAFEGTTIGEGEYLPVAKAGNKVSQVINELFCMKKGTTADTNYGEPDILRAIYDYLGAQHSMMYNISYFDNNTVPRLAIIVKGGQLSKEIVESIKRWLSEQHSTDVMNQILLLECPDSNADISIQPLSAAQLKDAGFLEYREACDGHIMIADRVPPSIIFRLGGLVRNVSEEANIRFLAGVVRPEQRRIEAHLNYIIRHELGVEDWVLDLNIPDLISERERAEIWGILCRFGVVSINEVRRFYGQPPVDGGDEPLIQAIGSGPFHISDVGKQTAGNAVEPNEAALDNMSPEQKAEHITMMEQVFGRETVGMWYPEEYIVG